MDIINRYIPNINEYNCAKEARKQLINQFMDNYELIKEQLLTYLAGYVLAHELGHMFSTIDFY